MKKIILSLLLTLPGLLLHAQYGYVPGYIIKLNGDTLNGLVYYKSDGELSKSCVFRRFDIAESISYSASRLKGYGFVNGRHFESLQVMGKLKFMECVHEGDLSLFIEPGKSKGKFYIKHKGSNLIKLLPGKNTVEGMGEWASFREVLAYLMADYSGTEINNTSYTIESLTNLIKKYNTQKGQIGRTYNLTPSSHLLGDFTLNKSKPYVDFGIAAGYQFALLQINNTKKNYLKAGDYYTSPRLVAGFYLSRKTTNAYSNVSYDISALFFNDTYYAFSAYESLSYTYSGDILIDLTGIQVPAGFKIDISDSEIKPYIKAGGMYTFLIKTNYTRIEEEFDLNFNIVRTNVDHHYNITSAIAFHGALGIELPFGLARRIAFELMYQRDAQNLRNPAEVHWGKLYNNNFSLIIRTNL